jgi:hypothetical protein
MSEHEIGGQTYVIGKLDALQQFDVMRRLGLMTMFLEDELEGEHVTGARFIAGLTAGYLAQIPQSDLDFVKFTCFSAVRVERGAGPPKAILNAAGKFQFDDLSIASELDSMLELLDLVLQESLSSFFERQREARRKRSAEAMNGASTSQ